MGSPVATEPALGKLLCISYLRVLEGRKEYAQTVLLSRYAQSANCPAETVDNWHKLEQAYCCSKHSSGLSCAGHKGTITSFLTQPSLVPTQSHGGVRLTERIWMRKFEVRGGKVSIEVNKSFLFTFGNAQGTQQRSEENHFTLSLLSLWM